jgi:hypothetical protein
MPACSVLFLSSLLALGADPSASPSPAPYPGNQAPAHDTLCWWAPSVLPDAPTEPVVPEVPEHHLAWAEVWGFIGLEGFGIGTRTAPNGLSYHPLFDADSELNVGLLPHKKLYLFVDMDFWGQRATTGVTNPHQGPFDFSKREFDVTGGVAWNYWGPMELRAFGYAFNNLNRGISPNLPYGYNDGVGVENRFYLPSDDPYDVGRQGFLSIGYLPSNALMGFNAQQFKPGLFLHSYLTYDLPLIRSYLYLDGQYFGEAGVQPRLLSFDTGLAIRPFPAFQNLEFRLGGGDIYDVQVHHGEGFGYGAIRFQF